jgi:hypothetical protein
MQALCYFVAPQQGKALVFYVRLVYIRVPYSFVPL